MKKLKFLTVFLLLLTLRPAFSQETEEVENTGKGFVIGVNFGIYFPGKYTANFYNGSESNDNKMSYVMDNYTWRNEIKNALGSFKSVEVAGLPEDMHYNPVFYPGLLMQYNFSRTFAIVFEFDYLKLKANDAVLLYIDKEDFPTNPERYEKLIPIRGVEERVYINLGVKKIVPISETMDFFGTAGLNINSTKARKNFIYVGGTEYSLIDIYGGYYQPGVSQEYAVYQGGIGWGLWGSLGASLHFGNSVLETGLDITAVQVHLNGYERITPGAGFFIRFLLNPFDMM